MAFKPGCFGSPLCYSDTGLPCTVCPYRADCEMTSEEVAQKLRTQHGISEAIVAANKAVNRVVKAKRKSVAKPVVASASAASQPVKVEKSVMVEPPPSGLPVKAQDLKRKLDARGINLKRAVARGVNPFQGQTPAFMGTIMELLLNKPFSRREAIDLLCARHGWNESSASSHLSFTLPLLMAEGVARIEGDQIIKEAVQ